MSDRSGSHRSGSEEHIDRRGVGLLDDLVREQRSSRSIGQRGATARGVAGRLGDLRYGALPAVVGGVLVVVVIAGGLVWFRRPASADATLPMASGAGASAASSAGANPGGDGAGAGPGDSTLPQAASSTVAPGPVVVHVAGAVQRPGVVQVDGGSRVADAVAAAGGLRPDADPDRVNLAALLHDGERIAVPVVGQPAPAAVGAAGASGGPATGTAGDAAGSSSGVDSGGTVDLNTASADELESLPGVGPATAAAIVDRRTTSGPFRSVDDLLDVRGIGDAKLAQIRPHVTVG